MDQELIINFDPPIVFNGESTHEMSLKEPTVAQVEQADKLAGGGLSIANIRAYQTALVVAVSGKPKQIVSQMKISDMNRAFEYLMLFINGSPTTGETSLPT